jgi:hypothetical protein
MTTIRQLIQTSPARANELFAKLVDTSNNAVKTRERLFSELKEELELLAGLEEEHLFPILKKHKQTKDLVREALDDNKQTRKLLADLENTPKDADEFATKVAELRRTFQQHVRDEKKDLLPAVLKALSDEEAQAVVEKIEAEKAEIEQAKRAEVEERRASARREREQVEATQEAAESVAGTFRAGFEIPQQVTQTAQRTVQSGLETAANVALRSSDEMMRLLGWSGEQTQEVAGRTVQSLEAVAQSSAVLAGGIQEISREWVRLAQERMRSNVDGLNALAQCRSLQDLVAVQTDLVRGNLQRMIDNTRRIAEMSLEVAEEAATTIKPPERKASLRRAA